MNTDQIKDIAPLNQIKVLAYRDKGDWILETKYNIGSKKKKDEAWRFKYLCYNQSMSSLTGHTAQLHLNHV